MAYNSFISQKQINTPKVGAYMMRQIEKQGKHVRVAPLPLGTIISTKISIHTGLGIRMSLELGVSTSTFGQLTQS